MIFETHCHTHYSPDSLARPEAILRACQRRGIDRIAITDHNTTAGALKAQAVDPERVIVGEEIMTPEGEILAFFLQEEIPAGLSPEETIARLREQGAFISVSHPFDHVRHGSWHPEDLLRIAPLVDAVEVFNARCWGPAANNQALQFARQHDLAVTAGSDAHAIFEIGSATLHIPEFTVAGDLRQVIHQAQVIGRLSPPWVHMYSRYAFWSKQLGHRSPGK